jgi:hypothetical protein
MRRRRRETRNSLCVTANKLVLFFAQSALMQLMRAHMTLIAARGPNCVSSLIKLVC